MKVLKDYIDDFSIHKLEYIDEFEEFLVKG